MKHDKPWTPLPTNGSEYKACRCGTCKQESENGKGLMWWIGFGPIRDLEVNA